MFSPLKVLILLSLFSPMLHADEKFLLSCEIPDFVTEVIVKKKTPKPVILIMGGAHGNEPAGVEALRAFIKNYDITRGTLIIIPIQSPLAFKKKARSSAGTFPNHYFNIGRAFPAKKSASGLRDQHIQHQLSGKKNIWWWLSGDKKILSSRRMASEPLLDNHGFRQALHPHLKKAGQNIFLLMKGEFPNGQKRYDQIDYLLDLHESTYSYASTVSAADRISYQFATTALLSMKRLLRKYDLPAMTPDYTPIPTGAAWAAHYELSRPAIALTLETDQRAPLAKRISQHTLLLKLFLEKMGVPVRLKSQVHF